MTFKPLTLADTRIDVWQERDRLVITLTNLRSDDSMYSWTDAEAHEAIRDGFLDIREAKLGGLERHVRQGGALHKSAFDYWEQHIRKPRKGQKA